MTWTKKIDLFTSLIDPAEIPSDFLINDSISLDLNMSETPNIDTDSFIFNSSSSDGSVMSFGSGAASASFIGFASGSGSSSVSGSASAFVAPDGTSGSSLNVAASGDVVGGTGSTTAGDDFDSFTLGTPEIDLSGFDWTPTPAAIDLPLNTFEFNSGDFEVFF